MKSNTKSAPPALGVGKQQMIRSEHHGAYGSISLQKFGAHQIQQL